MPTLLQARKAPCVLLAGLLLLSGCNRGFFTAQGKLTSDGGVFSSWSETPQGCARNPIDRNVPGAEPLPDGTTVASFYWEDPAAHNMMLRDHRADDRPEVPLELDLLHTGAGDVGRLRTIRHAGVRLDAAVCSKLSIRSSDQPPSFAGVRPSLAGEVNLDCTVEGSHLTSSFTFAHCEY